MKWYDANMFEGFGIEAVDDDDAILKITTLARLSSLPTNVLASIANRAESVRKLVEHSSEQDMATIASAVEKDPAKINRAVSFLNGKYF